MNLRIGDFEALKRSEGLSPETVRTYVKCVRLYLEWIADQKTHDKEPNDANARAFLLHLMGKGYKPSSLVLYRASLCSYFEAMGHELKHVKLPSPKFGPPKYYSVADFKRLYASAETPLDKAMLSVDYSTAMRLCELRTRKIKDFDITDARTASVFVSGKTADDTNSFIPLMPSAVRDLRAYLESLPIKLGPEDFVFFGKVPSIPMSAATARNHMYRLKTKAGILEGGAWHRIRHTRLTHLRDKDVPMSEIQAMGRHKDPKTTERYARATPEHLRKKVQGTDIL
jgi:site-specific recombinase XerD